MKKQHKTYLLLGAVLAIWGLIGHQIYSRLNPSIPELETYQGSSSFQKEKVTETSFYEIQKQYRDPFLGKFPTKKKKNQTRL